MSGIFGFHTIHSADPAVLFPPLEAWNRCYGREGFGRHSLPSGGLGCYVEHLTTKYPAPSPVLLQKDCTAVVDALLYNRDELFSLLGTEPQPISDEALLLRLIEVKGFESLAQVNGDFAGAIWDPEAGCWHFFRDHSGVRPLFCYQDDSLLAFSTDLRALAALPGVDLSVNEERLYLRMMGHNELSLCGTDYRNIRCFRPGTHTQVTPTEAGFQFRETPFWKWKQKKIRLSSDKAYQDTLRELITDAIRRRLEVFDGPAGCELSGGLDSSVIAILINRFGREGRYFSWSWSLEDRPLQERDERLVVQDICDQEGISCQYAQFLPPQPVEHHFDRVDPPYLNTRQIYEGSQYFASEGVRAVFSGHGGDEGPSHRLNFLELWYHREYYAFFRNIYRYTKGENLRLLRAIKRSLEQIFKVNAQLRKPYKKHFSTAEAVLTPEFKARLAPQVKPQPLPFAYDPVAYVLQGGHRVRLDNVAIQGAEGGVRYLLPFIDYRVLDYCFSIPRAQFHNGHTNRWIYRAAFDHLFPESLRAVHYKDAPSKELYVPDIDLYAHFQETRDALLNRLDPELWKDYLDLDAIRKLNLPKDFTRRDFVLASAILEDIIQCCAIEHTAKNAQNWRDYLD